MARPTIFKHRKFRRLVALLGMPDPHVLGHLECLWHAAYESGDERLGDAVDVELAAQWTGEQGKLAEALVACGGETSRGFVVEDGGVYRVHDLYDHAPDYVRKRKTREEERRERRERSAKRRQREPNGGQRRTTADNGGLSPVNVRTPAPAPAPAPSLKISAPKTTPHPDEGIAGGPAMGEIAPTTADYRQRVKEAFLDARSRYFQAKNGRKPGPVSLDGDEIKRVIEKALKRYDVDTVCDACRGIFLSPWHTGENPDEKEYLDIRIALRLNKDTDNVMKLSELARETQPGGRLDPRKVGWR